MDEWLELEVIVLLLSLKHYITKKLLKMQETGMDGWLELEVIVLLLSLKHYVTKKLLMWNMVVVRRLKL